MKSVPVDLGALASFKDLAKLSVVDLQLRADIGKLLDVGTPLFRAEIDVDATLGTDVRRVVYKPSDSLLALVAASRARNGQLNDPDQFASGLF